MGGPDAMMPDGLFAPLCRHHTIVAAVSGGGDSLGLMLLLNDWRQGRPVTVHVATVDHGLQPQSAEVATYVAAEAGRLGLPCAILNWAGDKPKTGLQAAARRARYDLLLAFAQDVGAGAIVTAHTADDQRETVLMRLMRGSGPRGLVAMEMERPLSATVSLVRPLLGMRRAMLHDLCEGRGVIPFDDPANTNSNFSRTRLRRLMPVLEAEGFSAERAALLARRMAAQAVALDHAAQRLAAAVPGDIRFWLEEPVALAQTALAALIHTHGDAAIAERLEALEALSEAILAALAQQRAFSATLRGALIRLSAKGHLSVQRAPARRSK